MKFLKFLVGIPAAIIIGFLLYVLFLYVNSLFIDSTKEYESDSKYYRALLVGATWLLIHLARIKVDITGVEKIPEGRFLIVSNHRSKFDPMISWVILKKYQIAFVSKAENFNIPIFGRFIRKCAFMSIDRQNPREAMHTVQKAARLLQEDIVSVGIYPEGTRASSMEMLPFRNGCFKIAKMAEVPIVIMAITGTQKINKNSPWHKVHVHFEITDVISKEDVSKLKTQEIGNIVRDSLSSVLSAEDY